MHWQDFRKEIEKRNSLRRRSNDQGYGRCWKSYNVCGGDQTGVGSGIAERCVFWNSPRENADTRIEIDLGRKFL